MPNASFQLNGQEVFKEASGVVNVGAGFPAGTVVQVKSNNFSSNDSGGFISATNTGGQSTNLGLSSNQNRLLPTSASRVYVEVVSVNINISNASNNILVLASAGVDSGSMSNKGSFGFAVNVPYSGNAGEAYDLSSFPWYAAYNTMGATTSYPPDWSGHFTVNGSLGYVLVGSHNVKLFGYAYNEGNNSGNQTLRVRRAELTVMEIKA